MSDKASEKRAQRTIKVTGKDALTHSDEPIRRERVRERIDGLLANLEEYVIRDGGDPGILEDIETSRRQLWEEKDDGGDSPRG